VDEAPAAAPTAGHELPPGTVGVTAPFAAAVWRVDAAQGAAVQKEDKMIVLEAMKMETPIGSPVTGTVAEVFVRPGETVAAGQLLAAVAVDA
ncbi:biotin/lipoyl-containing protein, partial [Escherichia coli]